MRWGRLFLGLFGMALGGAVCLLLFPLFPERIQDWVGSGQEQVVELRQKAGDALRDATSGEAEEKSTGSTKSEAGIEPDSALALVRKYLDRFNSYDQRGIEALTTSSYFAEVRPGLLVAQGSQVKAHVLSMEVTNDCRRICVVHVSMKASSIWGTKKGAMDYYVVEWGGRLVISGDSKK